ncbi:hypothetical protein GCM10027586_16530 [Kineococcus gypseus]
MTSGPDEPELDSAMATGNDEGEPGPATYPLHADGDDGAARRSRTAAPLSGPGRPRRADSLAA